MIYLILQHPGHNRVYYNSSDKLALAELKIACKRLPVSSEDVKIVDVEGIRYLSIYTKAEIHIKELQILSRLSFVFTLFRYIENGSEKCLIPIRMAEYEYTDGKISSLLKYPGKTNELFTKMMINVGLLSSEFEYTDRISLLDPVAGKGTTLFEGTVYGYDVFGVEIEVKASQESSVFFKKYLENEKYKHQLNRRQISGSNKSEAIHIQEFEYARSKEEYQEVKFRRKLSLINGNAQQVSSYFKKNHFQLIIGDLPYGIKHSNTSDRKQTSASRNPVDLLNNCLPEWYKVLKPGGCIVMAWNSFLVSRDILAELFEQHQFTALTESPYNEFEHMVDKSIKRDIIVARKY